MIYIPKIEKILILYAKGLSKGTQVTQSVKLNEMYKWIDKMKHPGNEPELVYHLWFSISLYILTSKPNLT